MTASSALRRTCMTALGETGGRLRVFSIMAATLALGLALPAGAVAQFSVQPVIIELMTGDSTATAVLLVRNESGGELQLRFYAADFDQPEDGGHLFMEPGAHPRSCVQHLQFYPDGAVLGAGEVQEIRVLMEPVDSTCWSMVFVERGVRAETGLSIAQRIGVKVYGVSGRTTPEGEIRSVTVVGDAAERAVELAFANLGGGPLRPEGEIEIRTLDGAVAEVVPVRPFSVLPDRVRSQRVALAVDLDPGTYIVVPILDFGSDYLAGGQAMLEVTEP